MMMMMMKSLLVSNVSRRRRQHGLITATAISPKKGMSLLRGVSALAVMISCRPCSCFVVTAGSGSYNTFSTLRLPTVMSSFGFLHQVRGGGGAGDHHDERSCPQQSSWQQLRLSSSSSSTDGDKKMDQEALTRLQRETSTGTSSTNTNTAAAVPPKEFETASEHVEHQKEVFDEMSSWFAQHGNEIPESLIPVYQHLAQSIISNLVVAGQQQDASDDDSDSDSEEKNPAKKTVYRILDVATGTGVLFPFLLQAANDKNVALHITAIDLAPRMIDMARKHADEVLQEYSSGRQGQEHHVIDLVQTNVLDYPMPVVAATADGDDEDDGGEKEEGTTSPLFDGIIINASFGNFFDPLAVLQHLTTGTAASNGGSIFVTHPLGSDFVRQLHDSDPSMVPYLLPASAQEWQTDFLLKGQVPLTVQEFYDDVSLQGKATPCYYSHLRRVRYTLLPQVMRFRGQVDAGYGRGGKKLGFPTANLPSRLFQDALSDVTTGVYFGWALLEGDTEGRNVRHRAVVNVGYSPTFEGKENAEKIIEAHLMFSGDKDTVLDPPDFYNETMRLELVAFLRPEIKFPSFPALIAQITADVQDSKRALAQDEPFATQWPVDEDNDAFYTMDTSSPWIGASGGDDAASWAFDDMRPYLEKQKTSPP